MFLDITNNFNDGFCELHCTENGTGLYILSVSKNHEINIESCVWGLTKCFTCSYTCAKKEGAVREYTLDLETIRSKDCRPCERRFLCSEKRDLSLKGEE